MICGKRTWRLKQLLMERPGLKTVIFWITVIAVPSLAFPTVHFLVFPATGIPFGEGFPYANSTQIMRWQQIPDWKRRMALHEKGSSMFPVLIAGFLISQLILTFILYFWIVVHTIMSTTKMDVEMEKEEPYLDATEMSRHGSETTAGCSIEDNACQSAFNLNEIDIQQCPVYLGPGRGMSVSSVSTASTFESRSKRRSTKYSLGILMFPHAEDYSQSTNSSNQNVKIKVPMTKVVLSASAQDITCTRGLSAQLFVMFVTFVLYILPVQHSNKIITVQAFYLSSIGIELGFFFNALIDPLVCLIFSSEFRAAVKSILSQLWGKFSPRVSSGEQKPEQKQVLRSIN